MLAMSRNWFIELQKDPLHGSRLQQIESRILEVSGLADGLVPVSLTKLMVWGVDFRSMVGLTGWCFCAAYLGLHE